MPEEKKDLQTRYEYLEFVRVEFGGKTSKWDCQTRNGVVLGSVGWHCGWRQSCYFPKCQAVYSAGCLSDISTFLNQLNRDAKEKRGINR